MSTRWCQSNVTEQVHGMMGIRYVLCWTGKFVIFSPFFFRSDVFSRGGPVGRREPNPSQTSRLCPEKFYSSLLDSTPECVCVGGGKLLYWAESWVEKTSKEWIKNFLLNVSRLLMFCSPTLTLQDKVKINGTLLSSQYIFFPFLLWVSLFLGKKKVNIICGLLSTEKRSKIREWLLL